MTESRQVRRARERYEKKHPPTAPVVKEPVDSTQYEERDQPQKRVALPAASLALAAAALMAGGY